MAAPSHQIRCSDAVSVPWRWSRALVTSLSSEQIRALRSLDALDRALAHESLTSMQLEVLYASPGALKRAHALRRLGRRIRAAKLEELCRGLPERTLTVVFGRTRSRVALITALAALEPHDRQDP